MRFLGIIVTFSFLLGCAEEMNIDVDQEVVRPARLMTVQATSSTNNYEFVGMVEAAQTVDVSFEVSGPLVHLPILEGQTIAEGNLIAAIDGTDFLLAVREKDVQLQLAERDYTRKRQLLSRRGISKAEVDDAKALYELSQVRLDQAKEALADTQIYAPFDAYIARRYVDNHIKVSPADKIARITDLETLVIRVSIPESIFATLSVERLVSTYAGFSFLADQKFPLQLKENTGEANSVAQTYEVGFSMPRPKQGNILPGMTATVFVELASDRVARVIRVPTSALVGGIGDQFYVWVFDPLTGLAEKRQVVVGPATGHGIPIINGLSDGEIIVVAGASQLREGLKIRMLGELLTSF